MTAIAMQESAVSAFDEFEKEYLKPDEYFDDSIIRITELHSDEEQAQMQAILNPDGNNWELVAQYYLKEARYLAKLAEAMFNEHKQQQLNPRAQRQYWYGVLKERRGRTPDRFDFDAM